MTDDDKFSNITSTTTHMGTPYLERHKSRKREREEAGDKGRGKGTLR